jgi:hypothetical protein
MLDDARSPDPRDDDRDRDVDIRWASLEQGPSDSRDVDTREREREERDRDPDSQDRYDPRDAFVRELELPRDRDRELVIDRDRQYELDGEGTRTLAAAGAFRVVSERDLPSDERKTVRGLSEQGLVRSIAVDERERAITLTERGRRILESHRRERDDRRGRDNRRQTFHSGVRNPRELKHDATLYRAYVRAEERLRERGADVRRVVLEGELKREYQRFLQERNRDRPDSDGRPDRDRREIEAWAREHDLPCRDGSVQFPDFRIEYEIRGLEEHEDIEVLTGHYRGGHAAGRASSGFTCYSESGRHGSSPFDPDLAQEFV